MPVPRIGSGPRASGGFSLLEVIVTLVVVSLILTVLMQALAQSLDMRERLLRHQRHARAVALQELWFRDSVSSAVADLPGALGHLRGDATALELLTQSPMVGYGLARVRWELVEADGGVALAYDGPGWSGVVVPAPLHEARFSYMGRDGTWIDRWAPEIPEGIDPATIAILPRMVRLEASTARGELIWLVPVRAQPFIPRRLLWDRDGI